MNPLAPHISVVLYHMNCIDGFAAAYAAWHFNQQLAFADRKKIRYIPVTHDSMAPRDIYNQSILMVDVSLSIPEMEFCATRSSNFLLLDHHKSTLDVIATNPLLLKHSHINLAKSGCRLAWEFFFGTNVEPPLFIQYIEQRDIWTFPPYRHVGELTPEQFIAWHGKFFTNTFYSIMSNSFSFHGYDQFRTNSKLVEEFIHKGHIIEEYQQPRIEDISRKATIKIWNGLLVKVVNSNNWVSDIGHYLSDSCDFAVVWYHDGLNNRYHVSLRSNGKTDVSVIARQFGGGGGHIVASSFKCTHDVLKFNFL